MGAGMAKNLMAAGFAVTAYNRTRAKAEVLAKEAAWSNIALGQKWRQDAIHVHPEH